MNQRVFYVSLYAASYIADSYDCYGYVLYFIFTPLIGSF